MTTLTGTQLIDHITVICYASVDSIVGEINVNVRSGALITNGLVTYNFRRGIIDNIDVRCTFDFGGDAFILNTNFLYGNVGGFLYEIVM